MSEYSSVPEDSVDADNHTYMDQDMLVVNEDVVSGLHSCYESVDVSDDETLTREKTEIHPCNATLQELKRMAFQKPTVSLTLVTEDEDGNVTQRTEEYYDDKHVTLIMDNEGESDSAQEQLETEPVIEKDDDSIEEDLEEALKDRKVMSSLMKSKKPKVESIRSTGMKRRMGIIVSSSDSEDDDFLAKMALMPIKSDDTPVLTVPVILDDGCLTDVENFDD